MAVCEVSDGIETKSCTSTTSIIVQAAACKDFVINPSATSIEEGYPLTLKANGCSGNFSWNNGLGIENTITIRPTETSTFTATCTTNEGTCFASTTVNVKKDANCGCGDIYLKDVSKYSCGFLNLVNCESYLFAIDCQQNKNPTIQWSYTGDADKYPSSQGNLYRIDNIDGAITVLANFSDGVNPCQKSMIMTSKKSACDFSITQKLEVDGSITLTQVGCSAGNTVKWDDGSGGIKGKLTQQPSISVPPVDKNYTAICGKNSCVAKTYVQNPVLLGLLVTSNDLSGKPKSHDEKILNLGETEYPVKMEALYCSGSVTWTSSPTAELNIQGNNIEITTPPTQTTTYIATCVSENKIVVQQNVTLNISSKNCFAIEAPASIEMGEEAILTVTENSVCIGEVTWFEGTEQIDEAFETYVTPSQTTTYTAKCSNPQYAESVTIKVKPCTLAITTSAPDGATSIKMGETITLSTDGCSAGMITWKGGEADGEEGNEITVRPFEKTTYTATCDIVEGCSQSITIDVKVDLPPTLPCEDFKLLSDKTVGNIGDKITLTANGCTGGTMTWPSNSTNITTNTAKVIITTCGENTYSATCQKGGLTGTAQVKVNGKLNFTVEPATASIAVNSTKPAILTVKGCVGENIIWHGPENDGQTSITNKVLKAGIYTATCNVSNCEPITQQATVTMTCPDFVLSASPAFIKPNTSESVTFTAKGCNGGEIIWWDNTTTASMSKTVNNITPPKTYKARCSFCPEKEVSVTVSENIPPNPDVCKSFQAIASSTNFIDGDAPITLKTIGYACPGTIKWSDGQVGNEIQITPTANITYRATCTAESASCPSQPVSINFIKCDAIVAYAMPSYSSSATIVVSNCYGNITWNGNPVDRSIFEIEIPTSYQGTVACDRPKCSKNVTITKQECPTLKWVNDNTYPTCKIVNGLTHYYYKYTIQNACQYYKIVDLLHEDIDLKDTQGNRPIIEFASVGEIPSMLIVRCFEDQTLKKEVCRSDLDKTEFLPDIPNDCISSSVVNANNANSRAANNITSSVGFCDTPIPMSTAATGYLAKLCEKIGNMKDENGNSFLKNNDGTMSEANAQQMITLVEQALKNSGNSELSNFTRPLDQTAILEALQAGNCTGFGAEMAKGYTNTITAGGYNTNILNTFEATQRTALKALYQLPDAIRAILARIRQGNIDKKESVSISDIINNYEIAFGMIKVTEGKMDYYGKLVLSDGITTVTDIHLRFSDNIVKVNQVPLPSAIDIGLKDRTEAPNTIVYGVELSSSNYISIADKNPDELVGLKQYLNGTGDKEIITLEQLVTIFPSAKKHDREKYLPYINKYFNKLDINTCRRISHFFSQVEGEVLQFRYNVEQLNSYVKSTETIEKSVFCINRTSSESRKYACNNPSEFVNNPHKFANYVYGYMLGNGVPSDGDDINGNGWKYRGRGAHQLTGKYNYNEFNNVIPKYLPDRKTINNDNIDVLSNPDLVGTDPELYILSAIWHWDSKNANSVADEINCTNPCDDIKSPKSCKKECPDSECIVAVTRKVNGGCNGLKDRVKSFKRIKTATKCN